MLPDFAKMFTRVSIQEFLKSSNSGQFRTVGNCTPRPLEAEKLAGSGKKIKQIPPQEWFL